MIIAKFGGTSVSSKERVATIKKIVEMELLRQPVLVVSALSGVTDLLLSLPDLSRASLNKELRRLQSIHIRLAREVVKNRNLRREVVSFVNNKTSEVANHLKGRNVNPVFLDKLVSYGEIMSSYIIAQVLKDKGIKAAQVIATDLIITNNNFGSAEFLVKPSKRNIKKLLVPMIKAGIVPVVTGFIGATRSGQTTTLGRGGSDYSASILGLCLKASEIQIWTDVDGIFTSDPRVVEHARYLPAVSFKEASELAAFGARVLHPRTIRPAISAGIPVKVLNTFNPGHPGTLIEERSSSQGKIKAVSFKRKIFLVNIYSTEMLFQKGFLARVFKVFARHEILVDLVSVSEVSVSVSLDDRSNLADAIKELAVFSKVSVVEDMGMVSLIGEGITGSSKTIKKVFDILDSEKILARMISLSAANINISIVVESERVEKAVRVLHDRLLLK